MNAARFVELTAFVLLPIALLRELWWSSLLFDRPWHTAKPFDAPPLDLGQLNVILDGVPAMALSLVGGMIVTAGLGLVLFLVRGAFLPLVQVLAVAIAGLIVQFHPSVDFSALWIMAGFWLIALNAVAAFLIKTP